MNSEILLQAAGEFDSPLYVYDAEQIISNYKNFENAFNVKSLEIHYACKALSNPSVLKLFKELGAGLDCVSINEVKLGLSAGFEPNDILFTPNNISIAEYEEAITLGVRLNVDNLTMLEYMGINHPSIPVCVRINPHIMAGGNQNISVGHIDSKFGISIHQMPLAKRLVAKLNINVIGIHVHTGSDILDSNVFVQTADIIYDIVEQFDTVKFIDFGSGFKVKYHPNDLHTDIEAFGKKFSKSFNEFCERTGKDYTLQFEPGKYMTSESGYFLAKVNLVKQTTACVFVGIDTGFNHLIRPMFYDAYHDIENISNPNGDKNIYNVVGYICESDTFATDRMLNEVRKDDILAFKNAGAYCFTMASNYNSRFRPAEVLLHKGKLHLIRERETMEDLTKNLVDVDVSRWF
ncbi:MAG: diaminopimelate decarboxylase [Flavobacteriales bacterium]|nr:diaminopimelate decarboxylase [Flavobacteriales bacterium]